MTAWTTSDLKNALAHASQVAELETAELDAKTRTGCVTHPPAPEKVLCVVGCAYRAVRSLHYFGVVHYPQRTGNARIAAYLEAVLAGHQPWIQTTGLGEQIPYNPEST